MRTPLFLFAVWKARLLSFKVAETKLCYHSNLLVRGSDYELNSAAVTVMNCMLFFICCKAVNNQNCSSFQLVQRFCGG